MVDFHQKKIALFFSHGISLKNWEDIGHLDREIRFYNCVAGYFKQVCFFTYGGKEDLKYQNEAFTKVKIFIRKFKLPPFFYGFLLPFIWRKELKTVDFLKTNQMSSSIPAVITQLLYKKKLIVRCGYEWLNVLEKEKKEFWKIWIVWLIERLAYSSADKIIFTSQKDKDFAKKKFGLLESKIVIISNYIDIDNFTPLNKAKQPGTVVFVGRISKEKNLFNLIEAISNLGLKLVIIGQGSQKEELEKFAKEKKASVEFRGKISNSELASELNKYEIFALPSLYEGCPKALLEAMSCSLACLGTDVEGIKEVIQDRENGILTATDSASIQEGLKVLAQNQEYRKVLGQKARETIKNKFGLEIILNKELKLYESI